MQVDLKTLFEFPAGSSEVTTGVFFPDENRLVTGHRNGLVVIWDLSKGRYQKLYECSSEIRTINSIAKKKLVIGSYGGDIVLLSLGKDGAVVLAPATLSKRGRVWKSLWVNDDMFLTSSTYGAINVFKRESEDKWNQDSLSGHSDSVFAMGKSEEGLLATGDYWGNIFVWSLADNEYHVVQKVKINGSVEDIVWHNNDVFVAMNRWGKMFLFERGAEGAEWKLVIEVKDATSVGTSISMTEDGKTVFGGSSTEVIQFDVETQQVDSLETPAVRRIFTKGNSVFVLTPNSLLSFERKTIEFRPDVVKYKYVKIGVVGHTGAGKSALCSYLTTGSSGDQTSTVGKRVWDLGLPPVAGLDRRITLHDYGGQETVLCTFLPFLSDSNIILILFKQTDLVSFRKALELLDLLRSNIPQEVRIFFVQTHIDSDVAEFNDRTIQDLKKEGKIIDNLLVSSKDGRGIEELKTRLVGDEAWGRARTMIQTTYTDGVLRAIVALQEKNMKTISLPDFAKYYENETGQRIPKYHLKFLLTDYSNQGIVEYYPEALDLIIFNEPEYNSLKTELPIYVMKKNGIVSMKDVQEQFKSNKFIPVIDALYLRYRIAIENFEKRIFPSLLSENPIEIPASVKNSFGAENIERRLLSDQSFDVERLISLLSEFKLQCISASKSDGLFSYGENAVIYYRFERIGDAFNGFFLQCSFRVGGKNKQIYQRLKSDFVSIVELLQGAFLKPPVSENKKKSESKRNLIYDVALSYASEQEQYVEKVASILDSNGINVWFDKFHEDKLWGRNLADYLMNVYYRDAKYCMMFISKDYVSKAWPTFEAQNAVARNIEQLGGYILPVRFDDSVVPGLPADVHYLETKEKSPEDIASIFMKKLEDENADSSE